MPLEAAGPRGVARRALGSRALPAPRSQRLGPAGRKGARSRIALGFFFFFLNRCCLGYPRNKFPFFAGFPSQGGFVIVGYSEHGEDENSCIYAE